jgi:hypothetical protein
MIKHIFILLATSIFIYSCQKPLPVKDNSQKDPACRVITLIWSLSGDTFHITYNNSGKVSKVSSGESVSNFEYAGNRITKTSTVSGVLRERKIIAVNGAGLATNVRTEDMDGTGNWRNEAYQYNGEEVSSAVLSYSGTTYTNTVTYTWQNHNMVEVKNSISPAVLELQYYTDKPTQDGDNSLSLHKFLLGYEVFRCRNLLKSSGGMVYQYDFDTEGKIVAVEYTEPGNRLPVFKKYEYECK